MNDDPSSDDGEEFRERRGSSIRSRLEVLPRSAAVVAIVAVLVIGYALWSVGGGSGAPAAVNFNAAIPTPGAPNSAAAPGPGEASAGESNAGANTGATNSGPAETASVTVSVVGLVNRPGLVTLPGGSRVDDALRAAGGALPGADLTSLNLAAPLLDGTQVVLGAPDSTSSQSGIVGPEAGSGSAGSSSAGSGALVNINSATPAELEGLPGVGPVMAAAIVAYREEHGAFTSIEGLGEVRGIGDARLEQLRGLVTV